MITVRPAAAADVPVMSAVMTASVTELCAADHGDDPAKLGLWLANKSPDGVRKMLANPEQLFFIAEHNGDAAAVGALSRDGDVTLNYVSPGHRFQGVSRALLSHMEGVLRDAGHPEARLVSTATARRFYLEGGWVEDGPPLTEGFSTSYPMRKRL